jgi:hypothetical protein
LLDDVVANGTSFEAYARPFAEFQLCARQDDILRLRYAFDSDVEAQGGIVYECEYFYRQWSLQFFRLPYPQREAYKVWCDGELVASMEVFELLWSADVCYADGTVWHCRTDVLGSIITDSENDRMLHTYPKPGLILGGSSIHIDHPVSLARVLPLLMILTHFTTHDSG